MRNTRSSQGCALHSRLERAGFAGPRAGAPRWLVLVPPRRSNRRARQDRERAATDGHGAPEKIHFRSGRDGIDLRGKGNKVYVLGQVNKPGEFIVNPRVDVMQALSMAGGTTAFASLGEIVILRRTEAGSRRCRSVTPMWRAGAICNRTSCSRPAMSSSFLI